MRFAQPSGSLDTSRVLGRELEDTDATIMHHLACPAAGDIDHLIIGPGGVTVIVSGRRRNAEIRRLKRQRLAVRLVLAHARPELRNISVVGCICVPNEEFRPVSSLSDDVLVAGAIAAAQIGCRSGELTDTDIAELEQTIAANLAGVARDHIDGPGLSAWQLPPGSRRVRPTLYLLLAAAVLCAVIGIELPLMLHRSVSAPALAMRLTHASGRVIVDVRVPAGGAQVALRTTVGDSVHYVFRTSAGRPIRWTVPRAWTHAARITVAACVTDGAAMCISPVSSVTGAG